MFAVGLAPQFRLTFSITVVQMTRLFVQMAKAMIPSALPIDPFCVDKVMLDAIWRRFMSPGKFNQRKRNSRSRRFCFS